MCESSTGHSRRDFLRISGGCGAHLALAGVWAPRSVWDLFASRPLGPVQAVEPWGRIEQLAEDVWAVVSTPLREGDFTTLSNGGIIAGREGVLAVDGFANEAGASWVGAAAEELTGRRPTHVVLTHYHGDHATGQAGYRNDAQELSVLATEETNRLLEAEAQELLLPNQIMSDIDGTDQDRSFELDLGGRTVRIRSREGHTSSDVTVEIDDPRVVWCGDLVWNGLFPNYRDARPTRLIRHVREVLSERDALYVPGHGDASDLAGLGPYIDLLEDVGQAATRAVQAGVPSAEAAGEYSIPTSLGGWAMLSPRYFDVAFGAWEMDLEDAR
jgi:glyoxylase-like metal-dependent hydrolase (beta-lactamase superfamily II)